MAKIGTAHVEIKPVLNEAALQEIVDRIDTAVVGAMLGAKRQRLAGTITLDQAKRRLFIDGVQFPYHIGEDPVVDTTAGNIPSLTVEIFADRVEVINPD